MEIDAGLKVKGDSNDGRIVAPEIFSTGLAINKAQHSTLVFI